ncbi:MAG: FtsW/RodA/SpoVE family cell cycle protein [Eubacterium sp.]|nr:FtsW/RodA/SpoVE family cell cycle protein [Eubacterium sp.]
MLKKLLKRYNLKYYNFILLFIVVALMITGVLIINKVNDSYTMKQSIGIVLAVVIMIVLSLIDYHFIAKFYGVLYIASTVLLLAVLVAGKNVNNAKRWFEVAGIRFQPSELTKILMIIFMAVYLSDLMEKKQVSTFHGIMGFVIFYAIPAALIFKQPDLSTLLCITAVLITMIYVSGLSYKFIITVLLIAIPLFSVFIWYIQTPNQKLLYEHQVTRILSFIYPSEYDDERMQQENSVMAIGSGQLTGKGLLIEKDSSNTSDTNLISEQQTDFIFSAVGETFGFFGSVIIIGIILLIVLQCIRAGRKARDDTGMLMATGVGCLIGYQSFINIGVATMLLPNTGIPLPFISYGLSSLLSSAIGIGIVLNISLQRRRY